MGSLSDLKPESCRYFAQPSQARGGVPVGLIPLDLLFRDTKFLGQATLGPRPSDPGLDQQLRHIRQRISSERPRRTGPKLFILGDLCFEITGLRAGRVDLQLMQLLVSSVGKTGFEVLYRFAELSEQRVGVSVLDVVCDHDSFAFSSRTMMPFASPLRSRWKNSTNRNPLPVVSGLDHIGQQFPAETVLLGAATVGKVKEDPIKPIGVDTRRIPHRIEVTRLVLRSNKAAIEPHPPTPRLSQQLQRLSLRVPTTRRCRSQD